MKQMLRLLLSFAPWIAFMFLAGHSLLQLEIALVVSAILVAVMSLVGLHKGAVLYASYIFFASALMFVVLLKNIWFIQHLEILADLTLFAACMLGMIFGKPFTELYAREEVAPEYWQSASFVRSCYITTSVWTLIFLLNLAAAFVGFYRADIARGYFTVFNYTMLIGGVVFTNLYSTALRHRRLNREAAVVSGAGNSTADGVDGDEN